MTKTLIVDDLFIDPSESAPSIGDDVFKAAGLKPLRYAAYLRLSRDPMGNCLGTRRQLEDIEALVKHYGGNFVGSFEDNDISASAFSTKPREGYNAMLKAAREGKIDVIVAWSTSRLTRRPREFEDLIDLARAKNVTFVFVKSPGFDLNTADGQLMARIFAGIDAAESARNSERSRRAAKQRKDMGKLRGSHIMLGYKDAYCRKFDKSKKTIVRGIFKDLDSGQYLSEVGRGLKAQGVVGVNGGRNWHATHIRQIADNPIYCGYMFNSDGLMIPITTPGAKPLISRDLWLSVQERLKARVPTRAARSTYSLSGMVVCGTCKGRMVATGGKDAKRWACFNSECSGRADRRMEIVESIVYAYVRTRFRKDSTVYRVTRGAETEEMKDLQSIIDKAQKALDDITRKILDGEIQDATDALQIQIAFRDRKNAAVAKLAALEGRMVKERIRLDTDALAVWEDPKEGFNTLAKRELLRACLDAVIINPIPPGTPKAERPSTIVPVPR